MRTLLAFVLGGLVSYIFRVAFIVLMPSGRPPEALTRLLRHAAPAAFASLIAVSVSATAHGSTSLAGWPVVVATAATAAVACWTRHAVLTIVAGAVAATVVTVV